MFGLYKNLFIAIFKIIGLGCFCGFVFGGALGLFLFRPIETSIQGIIAFLVYAPSGGIIGAFLTALSVLFVTYCAIMNANEGDVNEDKS